MAEPGDEPVVVPIEDAIDLHPFAPREIPSVVESYLEAAARALRVPTLLVRGRLSDVVSEDGARAFLDLVPHARYVDVSGAGHMVAGDRNDPFTDAVVRFLGEVERGG